jgi:hypothetical protein
MTEMQIMGSIQAQAPIKQKFKRLIFAASTHDAISCKKNTD